MSLLREGLRRNIIRAGAAALAATAILSTSGRSVPVEVKLPPCKENSQSKVYKLGPNDILFIGGLEITKGNNPKELQVQATSQEMSPLSIDQIKHGEIAIDLKKGIIFQVNGDSVEISCDTIKKAS